MTKDAIYDYLISLPSGSEEQRKAELILGYEIVLDLDTGEEVLDRI